MKGGSSKLEAALNAPRNTVENVLKDVQTTRGGSEAIDQTRQNIQREARDQADATRIEPELARQNLIDEEKGLKDTLLKDETFGNEFRKAQDAGVSLDVNQSSIDKQTEAVMKAKDVRAADKGARDDAYKAVGDTNAQAKMDEWEAAVKKADNFIPERIRPIIDNADGSFAYLNNEVRPRLSEEITAAYQRNDHLTAEKLMELRDNITKDQIAHLTETGSNITVEAAKNANKTNLEYTAKHNDGIGKDLRINEMVNRPKTQPIKFVQGGREIVLSTIKDPNKRESVKQLQKILGPEDDHLVADIALAESFKEITAGKGDIAKITADLRQMSAAFPDQQKRRIEGFLTDVGEKDKNIEYFKGKVKELEDAASAARDEIYQKKFKTMFKEAKGGEAIEKTNGYQAMKDIFKNTETDEFQHVLAAAKKDPESLSGLQAAWARNAEEILGSNKQDVKQLEDHFKQYGKEIFGDTPMIKNIEELFEMSKNIAEQNKARMANPIEFAKNQTEAHGVVNQILTFAFGVLNPTSARIRTISNDLMKSHSSFAASKEAADNILSSSSKFVEVARKVLKEGEKKLSPADRKIIFRTAVKMGIYGSRDQTNEAFQ
ncbi:MAG TPA: hypothetical protein PLS50_05600 [Candidatus Dojkabacteria bacterium]|nr:hypothetical protein [Candidatus Dojkabacteria bacterium]